LRASMWFVMPSVNHVSATMSTRLPRFTGENHE
jgi:hypothetical protein